MNSLYDGVALYELGARPIDRIAWRVVQPGEHWETSKAVEILTFDAPPVPPDSKVNYNGSGSKERPTDYAGVKVGRLTVWYYWRHKAKETIRRVRASPGDVRYWAKLGRNAPTVGKRVVKGVGARSHEWLCRCDCGLFCVRGAHTIRDAMRFGAERYAMTLMCSHCMELEMLRRRK